MTAGGDRSIYIQNIDARDGRDFWRLAIPQVAGRKSLPATEVHAAAWHDCVLQARAWLAFRRQLRARRLRVLERALHEADAVCLVPALSKHFRVLLGIGLPLYAPTNRAHPRQKCFLANGLPIEYRQYR